MADELEEIKPADGAAEVAPAPEAAPVDIEASLPKPPSLPEEPEEEEDCPPCKSGAPAWMATFADMATLLMAFFVLILSFAHMNVPKYKEVSGSMNQKFGVQKIVPVVEQPTAENVIAKQYKTAKVDPTLLDVIQEQTTAERQPEDVELKDKLKKNKSSTNSDAEVLKKSLAKEIAEGKVKVTIKDKKLVVEVVSEAKSGKQGEDRKSKSGAKLLQSDLEVYAKVASAQAQVASQVQVIDASPESLDGDLSGRGSQAGEQAIADQYEKIRARLSNEIAEGLAEVDRDGDKIVVRLAERGSFRSGYADLQPSFKPLLDKVGESITDGSSLITIEGHTDNIPMAFSERFRSNWDLSAARSAAVADYLLNSSEIDDGRVSVTGLADTKPLVPNDSPEGRSKNRRIEVIIDGS
ncbi:flagellar motor protein [marine gamma proteobacterium HTCC2207]|jgi:chemotaxis protein MotB|uniref:Flagellar motor protein n=1 Tax=gamma proteobacterium HTCC2207 TaxID=314287 RepID=Q1YV55_9GAMM|nr:flagellar motor protein [marine gamma proteobacterium HTCC2207] [gamma proteobacterium HTCC2207]